MPSITVDIDLDELDIDDLVENINQNNTALEISRLFDLRTEEEYDQLENEKEREIEELHEVIFGLREELEELTRGLL